MKTNLARVNRTPGDWGLEVGVLAEVFRNRAVSRVCQVDVADTYEHKHQTLSEDDASKGLRRMASDIAKSILMRRWTCKDTVLKNFEFRLGWGKR
jgi:glucosyl-3-phosphoglycerate synthase